MKELTGKELEYFNIADSLLKEKEKWSLVVKEGFPGINAYLYMGYLISHDLRNDVYHIWKDEMKTKVKVNDDMKIIDLKYLNYESVNEND